MKCKVEDYMGALADPDVSDAEAERLFNDLDSADQEFALELLRSMNEDLDDIESEATCDD